MARLLRYGCRVRNLRQAQYADRYLASDGQPGKSSSWLWRMKTRCGKLSRRCSPGTAFMLLRQGTDSPHWRRFGDGPTRSISFSWTSPSPGLRPEKYYWRLDV